MSNEDILAAFKEVTTKNSVVIDKWVTEYKFDKDSADQHQFVFFIKPEATADYDGVKVNETVNLCRQTLEDAGVSIGAIRVLGGSYLDLNSTMAEHYGVISNISRQGEEAISEGAKVKLAELLKECEGSKVLGGHQLLEECKEMGPFALKVINDNMGTTKLAGGTYAIKLAVMGQSYVVLNAFHAHQLVPYTAKGHAIIVMEGRSAIPWKELRTSVCGATNPTVAKEGSVRQKLLTSKDHTGMSVVDMSSNGCHMSAGPLEALVELRRFFSSAEKPLPLEETNFGSSLLAKGATVEQVETLTTNPDVDVGGKKESAFDITEEKDSAESVEKLIACL